MVRAELRLYRGDAHRRAGDTDEHFDSDCDGNHYTDTEPNGHANPNANDYPDAAPTRDRHSHTDGDADGANRDPNGDADS